MTSPAKKTVPAQQLIVDWISHDWQPQILVSPAALQVAIPLAQSEEGGWLADHPQFAMQKLVSIEVTDCPRQKRRRQYAGLDHTQSVRCAGPVRNRFHMKPLLYRDRARGGFTLIELLVVISIISILASM